MTDPTRVIGTMLGDRYRLAALLGMGGMGAVYRAYDRLTRQFVALKRVILAAGTVVEYSTDASRSATLQLAREFQMLASLRHPHIIRVLDYGFDEQSEPFFTMDLLEAPQTFLQAAASRERTQQAELIAQLLRALAYLHWRGIVHRDLKPSNVLVEKGVLRVLDFGLSMDQSQVAHGLSGTFTYLAPEIFQGQAPTPQSDLYAVGVMLYELFCGQVPFKADSVTGLIHNVIHASPDFAKLEQFPDILPIVERLLAKAPQARYASANDTLAALSDALSLPLPPETRETRESFLQASRFIGRDHEYKTLLEALQAANRGTGSVWSISGESGVGKSRLINEIRTQALVRGLSVVTGQISAEQNLPYGMWRPILRLWIPEVPLRELDASVLQPYIADLESLIGRSIPEAPPLQGEAARIRLYQTVRNIAAAYPKPFLLILEDIQWADEESLALLEYLAPSLAARPALTLMSYASDISAEVKQVADRLPNIGRLTLERLTTESIAALSAALLGEVGRAPQLLAYLQRETEGNSFFLVEVLRALAEEAGQLSQIKVGELPQTLLTGGIERILKRRLSHARAANPTLLDLAAIAGRKIDERVLQAALPHAALSDWLIACADSAVLEVSGDEWRFAHDRLRGAAIDSIGIGERKALHEQIAEAIRQVYAADLPAHAAQLAYHFGEAGNTRQEAAYAKMAGEFATQQYANADALRHFSRAYALAETDQDKYLLLLLREDVLHRLGKRAEQERDLDALEALGARLDDAARLEIALRHARYYDAIGQVEAVFPIAATAADLAREMGNATAEIHAALFAGNSLKWRRQMDEAYLWFKRAEDRVLSVNIPALTGKVFAELGSYYYELHSTEEDIPRSEAYYLKSLEIGRATGDLTLECDALNGLGIAYGSAQPPQDEAALAQFLAALEVSERIGDQLRISRMVSNVATMYTYLGDNHNALRYIRQSIELARAGKVKRGEALAVAVLARITSHFGQFEEARQHFETSIQALLEIGDKNSASVQYYELATNAIRQGNLTQAWPMLRRPSALLRKVSRRDAWHSVNGCVGCACWKWRRTMPIVLRRLPRHSSRTLLLAVQRTR